MLLQLMTNNTTALNTSGANQLQFSKYFIGQYNPTTKIAATGPNSSAAYQKSVVICSSDEVSIDYVATITLTNTNWRGTSIVSDPSICWLAFCPGNGTWIIGSQQVTISGDTAFTSVGATNGFTGINATVERN